MTNPYPYPGPARTVTRRPPNHLCTRILRMFETRLVLRQRDLSQALNATPDLAWKALDRAVRSDWITKHGTGRWGNVHYTMTPAQRKQATAWLEHK